MKFELFRRSIEITPETQIDVAFIEDSLGLNKVGDFIELKRISYKDGGIQRLVAESRKEK